MQKSSLKNLEYSDHIEEHGKAFFDLSCERGLEGIVGEDANSPYVVGERTHYWVKFKNYRTEEFYIGGFTGSRTHIESLLFGSLRDGELIYVGHTDKGLRRGKQADDLRSNLTRLIRNASPFKNKPDITARVHWVEPRLVGRVRFLEWTQDEHLRHSVFLGLNRGAS